MAEQDQVAVWNQFHLNYILKAMFRKYTGLQNINYGTDESDDISIEALTAYPTVLMPEEGPLDIYMILSIDSGTLRHPQVSYDLTAWQLAFRCDMSQANVNGDPSPESLFQCLNSILIPEIEEKYSIINGEPLSEWKAKSWHDYEPIRASFKQWMNDNLTFGLTQWGLKFGPDAKPAAKRTPLVVVNLTQMIKLDIPHFTWTGRDPRALCYLDQADGNDKTLSWLGPKPASKLGLNLFADSDKQRDEVDQGLVDVGLRLDLDEDEALETAATVGGIGQVFSRGALSSESRARLHSWELFESESSVEWTDIHRYTMEKAFFPSSQRDPIPPIRNTVDKGTLGWEARCEGDNPKEGREMTLIFTGKNKTNAKQDFGYWKFLLVGGDKGARLASTSNSNPPRVTVKANQAVKATTTSTTSRGVVQVAILLNLEGANNTNRLRLSPGEVVEIRLSGLAGTKGTHDLQLNESLLDYKGNPSGIKLSQWAVDVAP